MPDHPLDRYRAELARWLADHIDDAGAIVLEGKVHLFYQTYGNGKQDAICHAWSTDGLNFTRNPANPIFRPTGEWNCGRAIDADVIGFTTTFMQNVPALSVAKRLRELGVGDLLLPKQRPGLGVERDHLRVQRAHVELAVVGRDAAVRKRCAQGSSYGDDYDSRPQRNWFPSVHLGSYRAPIRHGKPRECLAKIASMIKGTANPT